MPRPLALLPALVLALALLPVPPARGSSVEVAPLTAPLAAPLGTEFTYQGLLKRDGAPATGRANLTFSLFDAATGGTQIGSALPLLNVPLNDGVFTVQLDFGPNAFTGDARFLQIVADGTLLSPRWALRATPYALYARHNWSLGGNSGTTSGTHFLGTTDSVPLELKVGNARALRLEPNATSPNLVGGFSSNSVTAGVVGATIGGGGNSAAAPDGPNRVTDNFGTVGGGTGNRAGDNAGTTADRGFATVGGGRGNTASGTQATVGGGSVNTASGISATVGGGFNNTASGNSATVSGGNSNTASGGNATTVGGGFRNTASGGNAMVGGGSSNTASGIESTVGGGFSNTASGTQATVPGGTDNLAQGSNSFAAGRQAQALGDGTFVWNDSDTIGAPFASTTTLGTGGGQFDVLTTNSFHVRATGGARFVTNHLNSAGVFLSNSDTAWNVGSHSSLKESFAPVDPRAVLEALATIPIESWSLRGGDPAVRHLGPMAEAFWAAFGLGRGEAVINTADADGVAFAAIQGLYALVQAQDAALAAQQGAIATLTAERDIHHAQLATLEARLAALERTLPATGCAQTVAVGGPTTAPTNAAAGPGGQARAGNRAGCP